MSEAENVSDRRVVGRYRIYEAIAAGGMATVHFGRMLGPAGFARTVAVKRLHREYARDPEFVAMFMEEARLAARVHHPNVVQTLDAVASEGELFLVMDYVPAAPLSQLLAAARARAEPIRPAIAAAIVVGVLEGLHAAHEANDEEGNPLDIVHRDVSPQNVLVGIDGVARVLDFGIAKASGRATQVTRDGQVKGKFAYMAPEQVTNVGVSRQSDIFAASIILWEMLTGARLFQAESEPSLLALLLSARIEPPSAIAPDLGHDYDEVVLRGLSRDLFVRYATGREMSRDLEARVPLASASQVGAWVEQLAGDDLARRAMRLAEIENESRSERVSVGTVLRTFADTSQRATALPARSSLRGRRLALAALAGAAGLAVGGAGFGFAQVASMRAAGRAPVPLAPAAAESATAAAIVAPAAASEPTSPLQVAEPELSTSAGGIAAPAAEAIVTLPGTVARSSAAGASLPNKSLGARGAPSAAPPSARNPCDPPYFADSLGHLIYKPECFH